MGPFRARTPVHKQTETEKDKTDSGLSRHNHHSMHNYVHALLCLGIMQIQTLIFQQQTFVKL